MEQLKNLVNAIKENIESSIVNNEKKEIIKIQYISEEIDLLNGENYNSKSFILLKDLIKDNKNSLIDNMNYLNLEEIEDILIDLKKELCLLTKTFKAFYKIKYIQREVFVGTLMDAFDLLYSFSKEYESTATNKLDFNCVIEQFNKIIDGKEKEFYYEPFDSSYRYTIRFWLDSESEEEFNKRIEESIKEEIESLS